MKQSIFLLLFLGIPAGASADMYVKNFTYSAVEDTVTYSVDACDSGLSSNKTTVAVYYDLSASPTTTTVIDQSTSVNPTLLCSKASLVRSKAPIGLYKSYVKLDPKEITGDSSVANNIGGPLEVCVGPDVRLKSFSIEKNGASVTYKANVCNDGSMAAKKFRVGFWHDRKSAPASADMGNIFKPIALLAAGKCKEITVSGGLRPNGNFTAWARADSGDFVTECRETNNANGPLAYGMSNPDLAVTVFSLKVTSTSVNYTVKVCNKGTAGVSKFYVDVYYHRPKKAPIIGEPGDQAKAVMSLSPAACTTISFVRTSVPKTAFTSYAQADADDFISEPNEANNLSNMLQVSKGGTGGTTGTGACVDNDGDTYGKGSGCTGIPDCDDNNKAINPGAKEVCGNKLDDDCDLTIDDGCPGVACTDGDGDGFGTGADCVLADCDDGNKNIYPWATEVCDDGKDNNCNKIIDDGCKGVSCVDRDMDGYGVGSGCKGVPDCDDNDYNINYGVKEKCGDKIDQDCDLTPDDGCPGVDCDDSDGDGFGTGKDCVLADCDDTNKKIYPWAPEVCGDNIDDNCNKIPDDGCPGRQCVDQDADGYGVGKGCPGPQDCDDKNFKVKPGAKEVCGDGVDDDCDNVPDDGCSSATDNDGDGHHVGGGATGQPDCNDSDSKIYPGAKEICGDKIDNDCDFTVDDGCPGVDCKDSDGDGWGVGTACKIPDCDDTKAGIYPWATEVCGDSIDNDCDGTIDDGCKGVNCTDKDLDGFGKGAGCCNVAKTKATCKQDCNDDDGGIYPWATEICHDGKDNDCDGNIDNHKSCVICDDLDSDGYGVGPKCTNWDCDDKNPDSFPGAAEVCNSKDNDCNGKVDDDCTGGDEGCSCATSAATTPPSSMPLLWLLLVLGIFVVSRRLRS